MAFTLVFGKGRLVCDDQAIAATDLRAVHGAVSAIDHVDRKVAVQMTKEQIENAPDFDEALSLTSDDRRVYDEYYSPYGW